MKKLLVMVLLTAVALAMAGCGGGTSDDAGDDVVIGDELLVYVVDLCYVNEEYAKTGDEELSAMVHYIKQHFFAHEGEQYFTLLDTELREGLSVLDGVMTMITDDIQFNRVHVSGGTAFVDLVGEGLSGGSLEEGLLISQIVNSLVASFEEVEQVQFLVDGEVVESLMGHYDASEPFEIGIYPIEF